MGMKSWKRILSFILCAAVLLGNIPQVSFAEETDGLCEHHVAHIECGFVQTQEEMPCVHTHTEECYVTRTECAHTHSDCSYTAAVEEIPCSHVHDGGCGYAESVAGVDCGCVAAEDGIVTHTDGCGYVPSVEGATCMHVHDEICGYMAAVAEKPCNHVCTLEIGCVKQEVSCSHVHDAICGYAEAVRAVPCDYFCLACNTMPEETTEPATEPVTEPVTEPATEPVAGIAEGDLGSGTPDGLPPVLNSITLSVTTVKAPGTIEVTLDATDDVSGVSSAHIWFACAETRKSLSSSLSNTYWDDETGKRVPYADGKLHGKIEIDQYVETGTFVLENLEIWDIAGNSANYSRYNEEFGTPDPFWPVMPENIKNLQFVVADEDAPDGLPPVLNSVTLSAVIAQAPGTIEVTVDATDDVSGVSSAHIWFACAETRKSLSCSLSNTYWDDETGKRVPYADGKLHGKIEIDQYVVSGTFVLENLEIWDIAGNSANYSRYNEEFETPDLFFPVMPESVKNLQFTVTQSNTPDGMPPVLKDVKLAVDTMAAPGIIEVTMDATDDVSGVSSAHIWFACAETRKSLSCSLSNTYWDDETGKRVPYADGKLHGKIEIDQYVVSGTFVLENLEIWDIAGNSANYSRYNEEFETPDLFFPVMPESVKNLKFNVLNAVPDVTTSVAKPEFVEQVEQAKDDAYIVADFSGDTTMPEEVFDAIAGTDKTLDLVSEGVTWRFNGEDIVNESKSIDLNVKITKVEEEVSASGQEIQEKLDDTPAVVMKFAENGQLPGKATIQIKVDYAMREYLGTGEKLCVYYYNNQTGKLELIADDLTVVNDTYIEFPITHCSYYVLTTKVIGALDKGSCGKDISWTLYDDHSLVISGSGAMENYTFSYNTQLPNAPWVAYADSITSVVVEEGVTHVGEYAFMKLPKVTSVSLPSTLKEIGAHAFQHQYALAEIVLPNGLEYVGSYAFEGNMLIDNLTIPDSITGLGAWAFDCGIKKLYIESLESWLNIQFGPRDSYGHSTANPMCSQQCELYINGVLTKDIVIPDGVEKIPAYAFYQMKSMTSITIPNTVTTIGEGALWGCDGLTEITIPDSVYDLGQRVLMECVNLTMAKLPKDLSYIPGHIFRGCNNLTDFMMPEMVSSIGESAFDGCANLTHFSEDNSLENVMYIGDRAFAGCKKLQFGDVKLSENLYSIGYSDVAYTFAWCEGLTGITIPSGVNTIPGYAFQYCTNLEKVIIENGATNIGADAFGSCPKLTKMIIPASVSSIGIRAFYECTALTTVAVLNENCTINVSPWGGTEYTLGIPGTTTILGKTGSTAETYAKNYGFAFDLVPETCEYGYHRYVSEITKLPACTEDGIRTFACADCDSAYTEAISCTGHGFVNNVCEGCKLSVIAYGTDTDEDAFWTLDHDGVLMLFASGVNMTSFEGEPWADYADKITKIVIGQGVYGLFMGGGYLSQGKDWSVAYPNLATMEIGKITDSLVLNIYAPKLTNYIVHEDNWTFVEIDGILYSGRGSDGLVMIYCADEAAGTTLRLRPGVRAMIWGAMNSAVRLEKLYMYGCCLQPKELKKCISLTDVYVISSDNILLMDPETGGDEGVFGNPDKVTVHGYEGSVAEEVALRRGYKFVELTECDIDGHDMGEWTVVSGVERRECSRCDYTETQPGQGDRVEIQEEEILEQSTVWINGVAYPVVKDGDKSYIQLPEGAAEEGDSMVSYDYHVGDPDDIHTQYPTNMQVWILKEDEEGNLKPAHVEELDNILQYSGSSIRITGKKGIRMITSVNQNKKKALVAAGLADYKLLEYGTALCWASDLDGGKPLTLGQTYVKSNYAYKRGVADPVFAYAGDLVQYTNVLVGFTLDQCKDDIAMRPYMILEGPDGEQVTIYGGIVYRSIGYIAYQNRNVFQPKTASYNYVWEIIHHVYGDKYDEDYKG